MKTKRILSLALAVLMLISLFPTAVFADDPEPTTPPTDPPTPFVPSAGQAYPYPYFNIGSLSGELKAGAVIQVPLRLWGLGTGTEIDGFTCSINLSDNLEFVKKTIKNDADKDVEVFDVDFYEECRNNFTVSANIPTQQQLAEPNTPYVEGKTMTIDGVSFFKKTMTNFDVCLLNIRVLEVPTENSPATITVFRTTADNYTTGSLMNPTGEDEDDNENSVAVDDVPVEVDEETGMMEPAPVIKTEPTTNYSIVVSALKDEVIVDEMVDVNLIIKSNDKQAVYAGAYLIFTYETDKFELVSSIPSDAFKGWSVSSPGTLVYEYYGEDDEIPVEKNLNAALLMGTETETVTPMATLSFKALAQEDDNVPGLFNVPYAMITATQEIAAGGNEEPVAEELKTPDTVYIKKVNFSEKTTDNPTGNYTVAANSDLVYNGAAQGAGITAEPNPATSQPVTGLKIEYKLGEDGTYSETFPTTIDAGNYTVYYKISAPGYVADSGSFTYTIAPKEITYQIKAVDKTYDGTAAIEIDTTAVGTGVEGETIEWYKTDVGGTAESADVGDNIPVTYGVAASTVQGAPGDYLKIVGGQENINNYAITVTTDDTVKISEATIVGYTIAWDEFVTEHPETAPATYDAAEHNVGSVTEAEVKTPDVTIKWYVNDVEYKGEGAPKLKDAGTYKVRCEISKDNYTTITDTKTVKIDPKAVTVAVMDNADYDYGAELYTDFVTFTGLEAADADAAADALKTALTVKLGEANYSTTDKFANHVGTYNAALDLGKLQESLANYEITLAEDASLTDTFTISKASVGTYTVNADVPYDGQPHTAGTFTPNSIIEEGGFNLWYDFIDNKFNQFETSVPTYTNAGEYTYQGTIYVADTKLGGAQIESDSNQDFEVLLVPEDQTNYLTFKVEELEIVGYTIAWDEFVTDHPETAPATYDAAEHNVGSVTEAEEKTPDVTIKWYVDGEEYTGTGTPDLKDAGTYVVKCEISKDNYTTISDTKTVKIDPKAVTVEIIPPEPYDYGAKVYSVNDVSYTVTGIETADADYEADLVAALRAATTIKDYDFEDIYANHIGSYDIFVGAYTVNNEAFNKNYTVGEIYDSELSITNTAIGTLIENEETVKYDGQPHATGSFELGDVVKGAGASDRVRYFVTWSGNTHAEQTGTAIPSVTEIDEYTISFIAYVKREGASDYNPAMYENDFSNYEGAGMVDPDYRVKEVEWTFTIEVGTITGWEVKQSGTAEYDGSEQSAAGTVSAIDGAEANYPEKAEDVTVKYWIPSETGTETATIGGEVQTGNWSEDAPEYKDAGTYTVYYKLTALGFVDSDPASYTFTIDPMPLHFVPVILDKEYDGNKNAEIESVRVTKGVGVLEGEEFELPITATFTVDGNVGTGKAVTINLGSNSNPYVDSTGNYKVTIETEDITGNITPRPVTVGIDAEKTTLIEKTYDGTTDLPDDGIATLNAAIEFSYAGTKEGQTSAFVEGDENPFASLVKTAAYASANAANSVNVNISEYNFTDEQVVNNYKFVAPESALTYTYGKIDKCPIVITSSVSEKLFDGEASIEDSAATAAVAEDYALNGTYALVTSSGNATFGLTDAHAGEKDKTMTGSNVTGFKLGDVTYDIANFDISFATEGGSSDKVTIKPLEITKITPNGGSATKTYDGNTDVTFNGYPTLSVYVKGSNGEDQLMWTENTEDGAYKCGDWVNLTTTWAYEDANVGNKNIKLTAALGDFIAPAAAGDIKFVSEPTFENASGTITPAEINITPVIEDKVYDGTKTATISKAETNEGVNGETVTVSVENLAKITAEFEDANVGENKEVTVTVTGGNPIEQGNYKITIKDSTGNITKQTITFEVQSGAWTSKLYGDAEPAYGDKLSITSGSFAEVDSALASGVTLTRELLGVYETYVDDETGNVVVEYDGEAVRKYAFQLKYNAADYTNYTLVLTPADFEIKTADFLVKLYKDYVAHYNMVLVFTDGGAKFTFNNALMYDVTSLGYKYNDADENGKYKHVYAYVYYGTTSDTVEQVKTKIKADAQLEDDVTVVTMNVPNDVNASGKVDLRDVVATVAVYNVNPDYMSNFMPVVIRADVDRNGYVDGFDFATVKAAFTGTLNNNDD